MVLEAMQYILKTNPNIVYLIGGEGPALDSIRSKIVEKKLEQNVKLLGVISNKELVLYHSIGDIFIMPNRTLLDGDTEGFGIVFIEANAAGNPVIGGKAGGATDAIQDGVTGFLVNPTDSYEIATAICRLTNDYKEARQMGQNGRERAWHHFRWRDTAMKFEEALNKSKLAKNEK
jgi:phosphatidylinositol alpha-1,6-mannosyltransferase